MRINAKGIHYRELNDLIHQAVASGARNIILDKVNGQRYIGCGLSGDIKFTVNGVPGNDLAAFMDGPTIVVKANAQDGTGNTMNAGKIIVHGDVGDLTGHSMRGGKIYIKGSAGYRTGIHMKSYKDLYPEIIIGETAKNFLGEYMAGGLIVVLGLGRKKKEALIGDWCGTGMHGGVIYIRGEVEDRQLSHEVMKVALTKDDHNLLQKHLQDYCTCFSLNFKKLIKGNFLKLVPATQRPYGKLYAY